jgi:arylsulfatase A-like enzyme
MVACFPDRVSSVGVRATPISPGGFLTVRRKRIVVALALTVLLAAAVVYIRGPERVPKVDPEAPLHYFMAGNHFMREELRCSFTLGLDRQRLHDVWTLPLQPCRLGRGWTVPKSRGVMAYAKKADVEFFVDDTHWTYLVMRVKAVSHPTATRTQKITTRLNGRRLQSVEIPHGWRSVAIDIPPGALRTGLNTFSFSFAYRAASTSKPSRTEPRFAIRLREIALTAAPPPRGPLSEFRRRLARAASANPPLPSPQIFDRGSGRLMVPTPGTLVMPLELTAIADRVELVIERPPSSVRGPPQGTLSLYGLGDGASYSRELATAGGPAEPVDSGSLYRIPVDRFAGQPVVLALDLRLDPENTPIAVSPPRIVTRSPPARDTLDFQLPDRASVRPDIVLITLDAARPDHFSSYGYERLTTPNIDRLAGQSLVFTNVFALVPNTHRSVPTMLTGLSFLNHEVTEEDSVLSATATTLAEYLRGVGYRTACFTSTPNNSRSIGTEQGYDEFHELWTEVPRSISRTPDYLATRAVEWLGTLDESQPFHLQLHFVPPHAPYDPEKVFDRFTDSTYDGSLDGHPKTLQAIDKKNLAMTDSGLAHIISLYDGNLRAADHAVERVLQALRNRQRWNDTVVLITSDHGEAFWEHGRMLHNNTVYDEMLRVPFILCMPESVDLDGIALDRTATLADIVPTLLSAASSRLPEHLDGIDLLERSPPVRANVGRAVLARTAHPEPLRCLRTPRWKVILTPSGQGELYDLTADPRERRNVAFENLPVYVGLGQLLTRRLTAPPQLVRSARKEGLPDDEREMLRTLGYLE